MSSREKILSRIKQNQPAAVNSPDVAVFASRHPSPGEQFVTVLTSIGGRAVEVNSLSEIPSRLTADLSGQRVVSTIGPLSFAEQINDSYSPHELQNVHTAIIPGVFAVAENGAIWITEEQIKIRVLPFICEHLAIVIRKKDIVSTLHEGYELIQKMEFDFGTYIAGPSKTADIEQSLVLGAHGSRSTTIFMLP